MYLPNIFDKDFDKDTRALKKVFYIDAYWTTIQYIYDWQISALEKVHESAQVGFWCFLRSLTLLQTASLHHHDCKGVV